MDLPVLLVASLSLSILSLHDSYCHGYLYVQRSREGLTQVPPDIAWNVTYLNLGYNSIQNLPNNTFSSFPLLSHLNLYSNQISFLSATAFNGTKLNFLTLSNNKLQDFPDLICLAPTLNSLFLISNNIRFVEKHLLHGLTELTRLDIRSNNLVSAENFTGLISLSYLSLSYNKEIGLSINNETFASMALSNLYMASVGLDLEEFPPFVLKGQIGLLYLDLSNQPIRNISCEKHLQYFPNLVSLTINNNLLDKFPNVSCLRNTLTSFSISQNRFTFIPVDAFIGFTSLVNLRIDSNPLDSMPGLEPLQPLHSTLSSLSMSYAGQSYLYYSALESFDNLRYLSTGGHGEVFESLDNFTSASGLSTLNLHSSHIHHISSYFFSNLTNLGYLSLVSAKVDCMELPYRSPTGNSFRIYMTGLRLHCDCCWSWIKNSSGLVGQTIITGPKHSQTSITYPCMGPERMVGREWYNITVEDMSCLTDVTTALAVLGMQNSTMVTSITLNASTDTIHKNTSTLLSATLDMSIPMTLYAWNNWLQWSACSQTCGLGTRFRIMLCEPSKNFKTGNCPLNISTSRGNILSLNVQFKSCIHDAHQCLVTPLISAWTKWTDCSSVCGTGTRQRTRKCERSESFCIGQSRENDICINDDCSEYKSPADSESKVYLSFGKPKLTESDYRPTAFGIGGTVITILVVLVFIIIICDLPTLFEHLRNNGGLKRTKKKEKRLKSS